jgi:MFS family permease
MDDAVGSATRTPSDGRGTPDPSADPRRWAVLVAGMLTFVATSALHYGLPFLVPALRASGLTLAQAGVLISAPIAGVLTSLVLWGAVTDRIGERRVLIVGLTATVGLLAATSAVRGMLGLGLLLVAAGATSSCVQVASGRLILGWFASHERGLAMGLRQTAQPLGVALAAVALPGLGSQDPRRAFAFLAVAVAVALGLVVVLVRDPAVPSGGPVEATTSPYRGGFLWRLHASSTLLVVPQFTVSAFAFDYLVNDRAWRTATAGSVLAAAQVGGAGSRLFAGWWSDRARSRLRPMRALALLTAGVLGGLAAGAAVGAPVTVLLLVVAAVLTASTNALAFTAVAERAGRYWAGRALGVQSTTQNVAAAATPPAMAALITAAGPATGYAAAFGVAVGFPIVAALTVPVAGERPLG